MQLSRRDDRPLGMVSARDKSGVRYPGKGDMLSRRMLEHQRGDIHSAW